MRMGHFMKPMTNCGPRLGRLRHVVAGLLRRSPLRGDRPAAYRRLCRLSFVSFRYAPLHKTGPGPRSFALAHSGDCCSRALPATPARGSAAPGLARVYFNSLIFLVHYVLQGLCRPWTCTAYFNSLIFLVHYVLQGLCRPWTCTFSCPIVIHMTALVRNYWLNYNIPDIGHRTSDIGRISLC